MDRDRRRGGGRAAPPAVAEARRLPGPVRGTDADPKRELRCADGRGSWRRKGVSVLDTRLLEVVGGRRFRTPADLARLLPPHLQEPFTNRALAAAAGMSLSAAGEMTYTLRRMGALAVVGRRSRAYLFGRT